MRQSSGLPTVKTASFYLIRKYLFRFFSRTWGHPKKSTENHRNAWHFVILHFSQMALLGYMGTVMLRVMVKTVSFSHIRKKNCGHFQKCVGDEKNSKFFHRLSIAPRRFF